MYYIVLYIYVYTVLYKIWISYSDINWHELNILRTDHTRLFNGRDVKIDFCSLVRNYLKK